MPKYWEASSIVSPNLSPGLIVLVVILDLLWYDVCARTARALRQSVEFKIISWGTDMNIYTGFYICPHCEEKFEWEFKDFGFRKGAGEMFVPFEIADRPKIAQCSIVWSNTQEKKIIRCYCTHCQMPVELEDTGDIPQDLLA